MQLNHGDMLINALALSASKILCSLSLSQRVPPMSLLCFSAACPIACPAVCPILSCCLLYYAASPALSCSLPYGPATCLA